MRYFLSLVVLVSAPVRLSAQVSASAVQAAVETITAADMARHIAVIADDSMMGRDTPSPGIEMAARYIAGQFEQFGLRPGGDEGTWLHRYQVGGSGATAPNVVGIIDGTDPTLKNEYLVFIAHMDAKGIVSGAMSDSIRNGADDNASGTAGVLELAQAFGRAGVRPRRSLMFVTFSGEEKMGWGSKAFLARPPVPIAQMVASINLDMISRNAVDSIKVLGTGDSDLGAVVERVALAHPGLQMSAVPSGGAFSFESDHYFFAQHGVPVLYFKNGGHPDYHRVSDSADKSDSEKAARVTRFVFLIGQAIADADRRPEWNEKGRAQLEKVSPTRDGR